MLKRFFNKNEVSVEERLDVIENSLVQISNYLYKQEKEADRKNRKVLERLDFLIKEASEVKGVSFPGSWKKDIDTMSESTKKRINVTKVLESDTALLQVSWNIVKSENDKHAKGN